jgi:hypothetical protein
MKLINREIRAIDLFTFWSKKEMIGQKMEDRDCKKFWFTDRKILILLLTLIVSQSLSLLFSNFNYIVSCIFLSTLLSFLVSKYIVDKDIFFIGGIFSLLIPCFSYDLIIHSLLPSRTYDSMIGRTIIAHKVIILILFFYGGTITSIFQKYNRQK